MAKCLEGLEFVQITQPGEQGNLFMQVEYPHIIGQMVTIDQRETEEIESFMIQIANGRPVAKVPGYSIFILPAGTLDNERPGEPEMKAVLQRMAAYVHSDKMPIREGRYLRFKEGGNFEAQIEKGRYFSELRKARRAAREKGQE